MARESSLAQILEPIHVSTDHRLINIGIELCRFQTKSPYTFSLHSSAVSGKKVSVMCYLMQLYIMSSSGTTVCIQSNIFSCPECLKLQKVAFHFLRQCLYAEYPSSIDESAYLQLFVGNSANRLYSMLFSLNSFFTRFTVSSSGDWLRYAT